MSEQSHPERFGLRPTQPARLAPLDPADARESVIAFLGGAVRKGHWEPAARIDVLSVCGGAQLDFREAELLEGDTEVRILAVMGGVSLTLPPDIHVEVRGLGLMGGFSHHQQQAPDPDAPRLRITGIALLGGVGIKVKDLETRKGRRGRRRPGRA
ncbi:MAG: LiaF domain-containing protein [Myxococcota bacterium]